MALKLNTDAARFAFEWPHCEWHRNNSSGCDECREATEEHYVKIRVALKELCEVKIIKDVQGDTPEYRERKPRAWEAAFACFKEYRK